MDNDLTIKAQEIAFDALFSYLPINFYWMDKNGYLQGCNQGMLDMLKLSSVAEVKGKHMLELVETSIEAWENSQKVVKTKLSVEGEEPHLNADGSEIIYWTIKNPIFDNNNEVIGVVGISLDISEKKRSQKRANLVNLANQVAIEALFEHLPITFYWMDDKGYAQGCNKKQWQDMKLNSAEDFINKRIYEVATEAAWKNSQQVMEIRESSSYEEVHNNEDGSAITYLSIKSPLIDEETNEVTGVVGIAIDITERKKMEEDLRIAKERAEAANLAKSDFVAMVSHELRTPLNGIIGSIDYIKTEQKFNLKQAEALIGDIDVSAHLLLTLVNDILDFASLESGKFEMNCIPFDLKGVIEQTAKNLTILARQKNLEIITDYVEDMPSVVIGDGGRIRQILYNLVGNAIKFTKKGHITINAAIDRQDESTLHKAVLKLSVIDTGIGIPANKIDFIFEKFNQLEAGHKNEHRGTGLGLAIVQKLIEQFGGEVGVTSRIGHGSNFWVTIPITLPTYDEQYMLHTPKINRLRDAADTLPLMEKVLVVEDNLINQTIMKNLLKGTVKKVKVVSSGEKAIKELIKQEGYHVAILDIGLIKGMDGIQTATAIRALTNNNKDIPLIALSAHLSNDQRKACIKAGFNEIMLKPVTRNLLEEVLVRWQ